MAIATINRIPYDIPELNFSALERAWPYINEAMSNPDPMKGVSAALRVIAAGLIESKHFDPNVFGIASLDLKPTLDREDQLFDQVTVFLKRNTKATEIAGIRDTVLAIAKEAGLETDEGEQEEGEEKTPNPSTEIAMSSLPS